jgi:cyclophilin family peptidyl-prolyl cis-trans isomerase
MSLRRLPPLLFVLACAGLACTLACGRGEEATPEAAGPVDADAAMAHLVSAGPHDVAVLDLGELGTIRVELLPEIAPKSVAQFVELAESGFYDGTYFHRVIPGFMIQGGDPNTKDLDPRNDGKGSAGRRVPDEFSEYPHVRGTVSMANTGYLNSSSSQFFIMLDDIRDLDGRYSAFGRVTDGMEVVDAVAALEIDTYGRYGPPNRPYPVNATIEGIRIERAGSEAELPASESADAEAGAGAAGEDAEPS